MKLIDGKLISETMLAQIEADIRSLNIRPGLGVLLVGDDAASHLYVGLKERVAGRLGIRVEKRIFLENTPQKDIESVIESFNTDTSIHGILVQLPLPPHFSVDDVIARIAPEKDVDGFHPENERRFTTGEPAFFPVFPRALWELLSASGEKLEGKSAVVVGNSWRFGNVMCWVLEREGIRAKHIPCVECASPQGLSELKVADIVISACGKERTITGIMLKEGALVIDGGIAKSGSHVVGDVDRASVQELDGWLSPVPGGVGPVTIACLFANVVEAAKRQREAEKKGVTVGADGGS